MFLSDPADPLSILLSNGHVFAISSFALVLNISHGHLIIFEFQSELNLFFGSFYL